jgi:putative ABC transport system substrate-binding protein
MFKHRHPTTNQLLTLLVILFAALLVSCGDQKDKQATIGIVNQVESLEQIIDSFKAGMVEQGYVEGETITYIYHGAISDTEGLEAEVQALIDAEVDMILSVGTPATQAAYKVTAGMSIPVVFVPVTDPIEAGIVENLSAPGGNLTGIMTGQSGAKELEWLKTVVPEIEQVFLPYNPNDAGPSATAEQVRELAPALGVEVVVAETPDRETLLAALETMPEDIDAILVIPDGLLSDYFDDIITASLDRNIPVAGTNVDQLEAGSLVTLGGNLEDIGKQAARLGRQVLDGTPAGDLPIEVADYMRTINLPVAEKLGVTISDQNLRLANEIRR